ncbi:MAG: T9SS type A sorting domain-containing protein [Flavobacteriaceae bacterium]|nr:T9SS type A sorting domain-containing protein [Flavobacteriaceae bacterium]
MVVVVLVQHPIRILPYPFDPLIDIPVDQNSDRWQMESNENTGWNDGIWTGNGGIGGDVQLIAVNSCGPGGSLHIEVEHDNSGGSCTSCDALPPDPIPNSADENFKLDFSDHPEGTYYIYIYDQFSNLMYQGQSTNIDKTVETTNIPSGLYYLHIHDINGVTMKQLFIEH